MKKVLNVLFVCLCCGSLLYSCSDDDNIDYEWKNANEDAFNALENNPEYQTAEVKQGPGYVFYKVMDGSTATSELIPYYTSVVTVAYKGRFYNSSTYFDKSDQFTFKIDGSDYYWYGASITGTSVISGWKTALQNMKEGEKWEVWIPWGLGYGSSGSGSIPGYSTLVFEIHLQKIEQLHPLSQEES